MTTTREGEVNFDGLVGPTHHYAGLATGNLASAAHRHQVSSPRQAALQGLEKIKWLHDRGVRQAILPPQPRPDFRLLHQLGFRGSDASIIEQVWKAAPDLLAASYSASCMWTANAATVSPSGDCLDQRLHLSPANLISGLHRSIEARQTHRVLQTIFADSNHFQVHAPLPAAWHLADEGAANHTRLRGESDAGLELFVFGREEDQKREQPSLRFPARQTRAASEAIARRHQIKSGHALYLQQSPEALNAGVFHNDVIAVGHRDFLFYHEQAYVGTTESIETIESSFMTITGRSLFTFGVSANELSLAEAVTTYLFNSQIIDRSDGSYLLLCPAECQVSPAAKSVIECLLAEDNPVQEVHYVDLKQSMSNGGGPACLRLRVAMTEEERNAMHSGVLVSDELLLQLRQWIHKHYREQLPFSDLRDPQLITESRDALEELAKLLQLPPSLFASDQE